MEQDTIQNAAPTKLVATRMPVPEYIKFLTLAMENKMSVSDLLQYKIYQEDKAKELAKALSEAENKHKELSEELSERTKFFLEWKETAEKRAVNERKLQTELSDLKKQITSLNEAEKRYKGEINADSKTVSELKAQITKLQNEKAELLKVNTQWNEAYNNLKALASGVRDEVIKHMQKTFVFYDLPLEKIVNKLK